MDRYVDPSASLPGGISELEPPVPIPNTEVKRLSADDTAWATAWEHRPVPGSLAPPPCRMTGEGPRGAWTMASQFSTMEVHRRRGMEQW